MLIYALEDDTERGAVVRERMARATGLAISPLVMLECLVWPKRKRDLALEDHYARAFAGFELIELGVPVFLRATELRARHGLRTPDALHLAAAQLSGCVEFWTNDTRLATSAPALAVDVFSARS
jgi:predicted nucleic acid-binding protein